MMAEPRLLKFIRTCTPFRTFSLQSFYYFFFFDIFRFVRSYSRIFLSSFAWPRSCIISRRLTITRELRLLINFKNDIWKKLRLGWDLERKNRNHFKVKLEIVLSLDWIFKFLTAFQIMTAFMSTVISQEWSFPIRSLQSRNLNFNY